MQAFGKNPGRLFFDKMINLKKGKKVGSGNRKRIGGSNLETNRTNRLAVDLVAKLPIF